MAAPEPNDPDFPSSVPLSPPAAGSSRPSWETGLPPIQPRRPQAPPPPAAAPSSAPFNAPAVPASGYGASSDTEVKYDLAGNPIPGSGQSASAAPGQTAYSAGTPAGAWPPAPTSSYGYGTSENGTDRVAKLKWNWGAFFIPFWWSVFNGQKSLAWVIFLISGLNRVVPAPYDWGLIAASLGIQIYLGAMGHRLAWSSDRFAGDYDTFIRVQRAWMIWGLAIGALLTVGLIAAAVLIPGFLNALAAGPHPASHNSGYSNSLGH